MGLKQLLSAWLMPLPLVVLLLLVGCFCLWFKRDRIGRWLVTSGLVLLLAISCTSVSDLSLLPLESQYAKWGGQGSDLDRVVVMGAGHGSAPRLPLTNQPNSAALYRLLEGIAVYRANPGSKLILSGGTGGGGGSDRHAQLMAQVAVTVGVPEQDILLQARSQNTQREVWALYPLVRDRRFAVVTSAAHMPRAIQLFNGAGLYPQPIPTHFLNRDNPFPNWRDYHLPDADGFVRAEFAMHEYLGLAWVRIRAWLQLK